MSIVYVGYLPWYWNLIFQEMHYYLKHHSPMEKNLFADIMPAGQTYKIKFLK
jgi:hypothetical protein